MKEEDEKVITLILNATRFSTFEFNYLIQSLSSLEMLGKSKYEIYIKNKPIILIGRLKDLSQLALNTYKKWKELNLIQHIGIIK